MKPDFTRGSRAAPLLALAERSGASVKVRSINGVSLAVEAAVVGILLVALLRLISDVHGSDEAIRRVASVAVFAVVAMAAALAVTRFISRKSLRKLLKQGRGMLERLGW